jgi:hypothetical protein
MDAHPPNAVRCSQAALHFFLGIEQVGDDDRDVSGALKAVWLPS